MKIDNKTKGKFFICVFSENFAENEIFNDRFRRYVWQYRIFDNAYIVMTDKTYNVEKLYMEISKDFNCRILISEIDRKKFWGYHSGMLFDEMGYYD